MKILTTIQQVLDHAFTGTEYFPPEALSTAQIAAVEELFLRPVLGTTLYTSLLNGSYPELCSELIHPVVARCIKRLLPAQQRLRIGSCGIAEPSGNGWRSASDEALRKAGKALDVEIEGLFRRLHRELETRHKAGELPEYCPEENIRNRCRIHGGIVQIL